MIRGVGRIEVVFLALPFATGCALGVVLSISEFLACSDATYFLAAGGLSVAGDPVAMDAAAVLRIAPVGLADSP